MEDPNETRKDKSAAEGSSDQTSKKTLRDVEEEQKDSGAATDHSSSPSPDGQFDDARRERDDAGPM